MHFALQAGWLTKMPRSNCVEWSTSPTSKACIACDAALSGSPREQPSKAIDFTTFRPEAIKQEGGPFLGWQLTRTSRDLATLSAHHRMTCSCAACRPDICPPNSYHPYKQQSRTIRVPRSLEPTAGAGSYSVFPLPIRSSLAHSTKREKTRIARTA